MGALTAAVDKTPIRKPGPRCGVAKFRGALRPEHRDELDEVLASERATSRIRRGLVEAADALGVDPAIIPAEQTFGVHRRGGCGCHR